MALGRMLDEHSQPTRVDSPILVSPQRVEAFHVREPSLGDYWRILLKRKWIIAVTTVVVLVIVGVISVRTIPIYEATTQVLIAPPQAANPLNVKANNTQQQDTDDQQRDIDTKIRILQSATMADSVLRRLNLDARAEFAGGAASRNSGGIAVLGSQNQESARHEQLVHKLQANLKVQALGDTSLVDIKYLDPNPALAAEIANGIAAAFIEQNVKSRYDSTMQAADWLSKQLADLQVKMESSQTKLLQYAKEHNIIGTDDKQNLTTEKLEELNKELTAAQSDRMQKESLYRVATSTDPESLSAVLQDPILTSLRQRQIELQAQYALLDNNFGPGYTKMIEVKNQLDHINQSYQKQIQDSVSRIKGDYQAAVNRESMLQAALAEQTSIADQLNQNAIEYKVLKQEADSNRQVYDGLLQQLQEASLAAGLDSSNIRIVDKASVPSHSSIPNIPRNLEFALLIGLVSGVGIAFGLEAIDTTVRTPDQVESISGLPTLGVIPYESMIDEAAAGTPKTHLLRKVSSGNTASPPLISYLKPHSGPAEAYRALRTSILLSSVYRPPRTILVTSSLPRDGKTVTCFNIAIVLAQMGKRVLLLEADMRCPNFYKILDLKGQVGLSNILTGGAQDNEAVHATIQPNLFVIPAGPVPPHPAELLSSSLTDELLKKWSQEYDHVIVDSPPVISVTDPVLLSVKTDAVLLVVRFGQTTTAHLRRTCNLLHGVNAAVLGVVLNAADLTSPDYYYYHTKYYKDRYLDENESKNDASQAKNKPAPDQQAAEQHDSPASGTS
jgi:polysaccharide biosynthesis transport protein